ncbi:hypothetical protein COCOR_01918 [Corallococcus coralloides DSM 2259]|uniref:Uncharacterized protein n=1 Tax=Corallococcus coralloides (strain ATCC 25202 / DSM 2259 / NBRC 100086 / M2) TaxID=1144275 RepID=H8MG77_CORCM|nr:hypothetical protein COCOR_01918 [Corallococcus coralloides DSM 2259]
MASFRPAGLGSEVPQVQRLIKAGISNILVLRAKQPEDPIAQRLRPDGHLARKAVAQPVPDDGDDVEIPAMAQVLGLHGDWPPGVAAFISSVPAEYMNPDLAMKDQPRVFAKPSQIWSCCFQRLQRTSPIRLATPRPTPKTLEQMPI